MFDFIRNDRNSSIYRDSDTFFTRPRTLDFIVIVAAILNLFKESVEANISLLTEFLNKEPVSGAAFCKAREKIKNVFPQDLNTLLIAQVKDVNVRTRKGYRPPAFDGTTALLPAPKQVKGHFGIHSVTHKGSVTCLAQCLFCVDVLSGYILGHRLDRMAVSENEMLRGMLPNIPANGPTISLLGRGFGYYNVVSQFIEQGKSFCARMSVEVSGFAQRAMADAREDFITTWCASDRERETAGRYGKGPYPIQVRVTKVTLPTGETELLVSNLLDLNEVTQNDMKGLYSKRWAIEESVKKIKPKLKPEFWGCKKERGIQQEFLANIFMYNLSCYLGDRAKNKGQET